MLLCYDILNPHLLQERQMDLVEVLSFLLMMSTMELGKVNHETISGETELSPFAVALAIRIIQPRP